MCSLAYFLPVGLKAASDHFSAQISLGFLETLISLHLLEHSSCSLYLTKLSYNGMSSKPN